jgi:hypothetical protein
MRKSTPKMVIPFALATAGVAILRLRKKIGVRDNFYRLTSATDVRSVSERIFDDLKTKTIRL